MRKVPFCASIGAKETALETKLKPDRACVWRKRFPSARTARLTSACPRTHGAQRSIPAPSGRAFPSLSHYQVKATCLLLDRPQKRIALVMPQSSREVADAAKGGIFLTRSVKALGSWHQACKIVGRLQAHDWRDLPSSCSCPTPCRLVPSRSSVDPALQQCDKGLPALERKREPPSLGFS